ncbi:MAG: PAS domain S-box-containing protein [Natronomonas sp.]|jgi:PAS domain S-box-containing protein|uniref:PAS domain-containing response regulator n=1 Tax=Natronomonas sp. TaxID=2184060 RepID=UPI0039E340D0
MPEESPIRVLHVEDDRPFTDMCKEFLEQESSITVAAEHDADAGLRRFEEGDIDCIISDHDMPGRTGLNLLRAVRERDSDVPFILFTGRGSEEVAAEALEADATDYLQKGGLEMVQLLRNRIQSAVSEYRIATSYAEYKTIVESIHDPVYVLDERGQFTYVNDAFLELTGYDHEDVIGHDPSIIKSEPMIERAEGELGRILSTEGPEDTVFEVEITTAGGETIICEDHMGTLPFESAGFEGSAGVLRNISDERHAEHRAAFLEGVVEATGVGIAVYTADGRFEYANSAYATLLATTVDDLLGSFVWEHSPALDPVRFDDYWASYERGETREHVATHERPDGETVPVRTITTCEKIHGTVYHFGTIYRRDRE